eukprot:gene45444-56607_t
MNGSSVAGERRPRPLSWAPSARLLGAHRLDHAAQLRVLVLLQHGFHRQHGVAMVGAESFQQLQGARRIQQVQRLAHGHQHLPELAARMGAARTLHSLLGARPDTRSFVHHRGNPLDVDVLIVDEASMVHLEMMAVLLDALPPNARLILLGDKDQLASVEAGAVLGDLCHDAQAGGYSAATVDYIRAATGQEIPAGFQGGAGPLAQQTVMLRESRRFGGPIGQLALAVNAGDAAAARAVL